MCPDYFDLELQKRMARDGSAVYMRATSGEVTFVEPPFTGTAFELRYINTGSEKHRVKTGKKKAEWKTRTPWPRR